MKASKVNSSALVLAAFLATLLASLAPQLSAQSSAAKSAATASPLRASQPSVQVDKVDSGDVSLEPAFQIAIYENLLDELAKTKRFKQVFRSGDRNASEVTELLVLKTRVEKYTPGSETRRAVTTVSGATKLRVHNQLFTRDGQVVLEWVVDGNVRFLGGNLRATHNLARNVANKIKGSTLPEPALSAAEETSSLLSVAMSTGREPAPQLSIREDS